MEFSFLQCIASLLSALLNFITNVFNILAVNQTRGIRSVNFIDNWWINRQIRSRQWRIPQMCNYIHERYGPLAEMTLFQQRITIVTDRTVAHELMSKHGHSLRQRFGSIPGLQNLNMYRSGLIWNNDVHTWKRNRIIFEATLKSGTKVLDTLSLQYFQELEQSKHTWLTSPTSLLDLVRDYTVTVTMEALFGINNTSRAWRDKAKHIVANYFKAWEYFLLAPGEIGEEIEYLDACFQIRELSKDIFNMAEAEAGGSDFINQLSYQSDSDMNDTYQCIAEMLLAGTDTSSLTMFYTLLYLADNPDIGNQISRIIHDGDEGQAEMAISRLYYESMRLIPVGPVILRQAESAFKEGKISIQQGDGIIFNVAGMNRSSTNFSSPETFNPARYDADEQLPLSFGTGKKSCVGKGFAEREMKLLFTWFLKSYTVLGRHESMVDELQTRWDIANAPVQDIKMEVFPRVLIHFVGCPVGKKELLEFIKSTYPRMQIVDGKVQDICDTGNNTLESLESSIQIIDGFDFKNNVKRQSVKSELIIHFPSDIKSIDKEFLYRSITPFHSLKSKSSEDRWGEIIDIMQGL